MFKASDKTKISLGVSKKICGYEIKKMHFGAYLNALERVQNLPSDFMEQCFPGKTLQNIIDELTGAKESDITNMISCMFYTVPRYFVSILSELTGISEDNLLNDPKIGVDGLVKIVTAVIEVNSLGESTGLIKSLLMKAKGMGIIGFKG